MLFAVADFEGDARRLFDLIRPKVAGNPEFLDAGPCSLGVWRNACGARIDLQLGAGVEGWIETSGFVQEVSADALRSARGDFALLAWTPGGLLAASGVAGGCRPLYVGFIGRAAVACTHLEGLLAVLPSRPRIDLRFLAFATTIEACPFPDATPYVGIKRVPAGEAWTLRNGTVHRDRIVRPHGAAELKGSAPDLAAALREELMASVKRSLRGRRRVAVAASGGLDSSAILAITCRLARAGELDALPEVYHFDYDTASPGDDRPYLRALAKELDVHVTPITTAEALGVRQQLIVDESPCRLPGRAYWTALGQRAVQDGCDLLFTGEGGDFVLNGEPSLLGDLACLGKPYRAVRCAMRLRGAETAHARVRDYVLRPIAARLLPDRVRRERRRGTLRRKYPWAGARLREHFDAIEDVRRSRPALDWTVADRYSSMISTPLESFVLSRAQVEHIGGHVQRDPFLDDDFLRFVATLPPLSLMYRDYRRGLLREAMRGLLPESLLLRDTKAHFEPAMWQMVKASGGFGSLEDLASVHMMADLGLIEPRRFRQHFDEVRHDPVEVGWPRMWCTLAVEAFLRHHASQDRGS